MPFIFYNEPELIIALKNQIHFIYPNDLQIFKTVQIPSDLYKCGLLPQTTVKDDDNKEEIQPNNNVVPTTKTTTTKVTTEEIPYIQNVTISPNREILAVTTTGQKALILYKCFPVATKLLSVRPLARASSSLAFSQNSERLLVTDKTGDCYEYDCVHVQEPPRLLLGHLSIVYKVLWGTDEEHIITCDRDDKIRITNYPDTYDIHAYCLGHNEFVADLSVLPNEDHILLSVSGDKTLHLWNYKSGLSLTHCELPAPGFKLALRLVQNGVFEVAVLLFEHDQCAALYTIYKQQHAAGETVWTISAKNLLTFAGLQPTDLCFVGATLYVVGVEDQKFKLCVAECEEGDVAQKIPAHWLDMVHEQFKDVVDFKVVDLSTWFKKHYDNVSDYLERKKRRIEEKKDKKNSK